MFVDNAKMINMIISFRTITYCDQALIRSRISWDQKWHLYTTPRGVLSYYWDNYSFFTGSFCIYPQMI
ncbi:hypothetical protein BSQ33_08810 [Vibrio gazogenes]|uniref:Uncharacterized protein n=1 Tax=Vibrio gazogenes TaxID=687 RepID=A0A1Z2SF49_VIBGA|nr:hypothetical protein BSQ33_08810 [Vibrio gazogenes]